VYDTGPAKGETSTNRIEDKPGIKTILDAIESLKMDVQTLETKTCVLNSKITDLRGESGMQVFLKNMNGKTITLELHPSYTITTVKYMIWEREGMQPYSSS
jgi:hypothetical protein